MKVNVEAERGAEPLHDGQAAGLKTAANSAPTRPAAQVAGHGGDERAQDRAGEPGRVRHLEAKAIGDAQEPIGEREHAGIGGPRRRRRYRPFCGRDNWGRIRAVCTRTRRRGCGRSRCSARAGIRAPGCRSGDRPRIRRVRRPEARRRRLRFRRQTPASAPARSGRAASFPGSDARTSPGRAPARGSSAQWLGHALAGAIGQAPGNVARSARRERDESDSRKNRGSERVIPAGLWRLRESPTPTRGAGRRQSHSGHRF